MKTLKILSLFFIAMMYSCNTQIALDDPKVEGTGPGALAVIEKAEAALGGITSISAVIESTSDSEMYGFEKIYEGEIKAEFAGMPGSLGNRWFETQQLSKGKKRHIKGVITSEGLKELHLLKKKVIKGDQKALSAANIANFFYNPYGNEAFYEGLKANKKKGFNKQHILKQNVFLESIEKVFGKECYVIQAYNPDYKQVKFRHYFGVKDGFYYGESAEVDGEDGNQVYKTFIKELTFNEKLPTFDVETPPDFTVEMWKSRWDTKNMKVGMQAPDWTLTNPKGGEQTLSEEYANHVILLDFWATWCSPCKAKMPHLQELYDKYKDKGLKIISLLSSDVGHEKQAADYIKKHNYTFDLVYGTNKLSEQYMIRFLPTVMMIDKTGKVIYHRDSPGVNDGVDEDVELENAIKKALNIS